MLDPASEEQCLRDNYREVAAWLKKTLPNYDGTSAINKSTIGTLLEIKRKNEERDAACKTQIADLKNKTKEYKAKSKNTAKLLSGLSLTHENVGAQASEATSSLANLAMTLGIQNTSNDVGFLTELYKLLESLENTEEHKETITKAIAATNARTISLTVQLSKVERILQTVNEDVKKSVDEKAAKEEYCKFVQLKVKDYTKQFQKFMKILAINGYSTSFSHERLAEKNIELKVLQEQVQALQERVESFHDLPSNVLLASVKLTEAKEELEAIKQELKDNIADCCT